MDIKIKKRIIGFLLLMGLAFMTLPFLLEKSVSLEALKRSLRVPYPPKTAQTASSLKAIPHRPSQENTEKVEPLPFENAPPLPPQNAPIQPMAAAPTLPPASPFSPPKEKPLTSTQDLSEKPRSLPEDNTLESHPKPYSPVPQTALSHPSELPHPHRAPLQFPSHPVKPSQNAHPSANGESKHTWIVQAGSFRIREYALALRKKLRKAGIRAYIPKDPNAQWTRVIVGPYTHPKEAQNAQQLLEKRFHVIGVVKRKSS